MSTIKDQDMAKSRAKSESNEESSSPEGSHTHVVPPSDPAAPSVVSKTVLDGVAQDSRVIDGRLYLVMQTNMSAPAPKTVVTTTIVLPGAGDAPLTREE